jgi:hypothetical protein
MKTDIKSLLIFTFLILSIGCSYTKIDKNKITGSWYFVEYTEEPYSKAELDEVDKDFKTSPSEVVKNFNYIFKADNTYEYKVYDRLANKGTYTINQDNVIRLNNKTESTIENLTVEYLDDKFLQVKGVGGETDRISIYYKTDYKFPPVRTEVMR